MLIILTKLNLKKKVITVLKKGKDQEKILDSYVTRTINIPKISLC